MDFTYFYKKKFDTYSELSILAEYDIFISSFNNSERVTAVFNQIKAKNKHWILFPEYQIVAPFSTTADYTYTNVKGLDECDFINGYLDKIDLSNYKSICIDVTGFLIPHLLFLLKVLSASGIKRFDMIYSEPNSYISKEQTVFSEDFFFVRQVQGFEGTHNSDTSNDLLIIASGYDDGRIMDVANSKAKARKIQLFGFPSLQADMYQENILKAYKAEAAVGGQSFIDSSNNIYAPANDPFVAAQMIKKFVEKENRRKPITNLYLCPVSTKPHALGLAIYYLWDCLTEPVSIIYPFCQTHVGNTTNGIGRVLLYTIELP